MSGPSEWTWNEEHNDYYLAQPDGHGEWPPAVSVLHQDANLQQADSPTCGPNRPITIVLTLVLKTLVPRSSRVQMDHMHSSSPILKIREPEAKSRLSRAIHLPLARCKIRMTITSLSTTALKVSQNMPFFSVIIMNVYASDPLVLPRGEGPPIEGVWGRVAHATHYETLDHSE
jgi:hypothetical protein